MKKRLTAATAAIITLAGTCVLAGPALADPTDDPQSKSTTLTATVNSEFTLTIPRNTEIAYEATTTDLSDLKVIGNVNQQEVVVTAETSDLAETNRGDGATIDYTLNAGDSAYPDDGLVWDEEDLRAGYLDETNAKTESLSVGITKDTWEKAKAGTYEGTITFTATMRTVAD